ncbi:c6 transcription factor [Trichoderma cornu-damae]|uniref:C6 transcription factor n=1 Tax=Trichoderma cornu-damae TaxID=654480 RepID=A0A9P8QR97_9HYPO|nr:c6 transcription factor [Trichoderma cornu-damae]
MWNHPHGPAAAPRAADEPPPPAALSLSMAEDDANSGSSHDDGSSADETTPAVASLSQNGSAGASGRKRKRAKCELCKARKVKCDRAEPACSWCARHNRACVYLERQKPGSRIGFGLELEAKVNRIDALLQSLGRRVEEHIANDHLAVAPAQGPSPALSNHLPSPADGFRQDGARLGSVGAARSTPAAAPALVASGWDANGGGDAPQDGLMPPRAGLSSSSVGGSYAPAYSSSGFPASRRGPSSISAVHDLPPHDIVYAIVDLYFKHCNPWCPILDRKTIFGIFFGSTSLNEPDRVLLHAIVATTLRFLKDPRLSPEMRARHHAVSRQIVQMYAMENISVAALRALVILSLDELGTSNGPKGWNLLSLLAQNVKQLGLCDESSVYLSVESDDVPRTGSIRRVAAGRPDSWIEDEGRRRICWMVYLLDRYATIATTTFDFMLDDRRMRRVLPCSYDLFSRNVPVETRSWISTSQPYGTAGFATNKPENLGSFSYHCEILRILSKVHSFLKTPVDVTSSADVASWRNTYRSLDAALDGWLRSLPSDYSKISALCHSDPGSRVANWFMLHGAYVTSVVRLHSSAAYPTVRSHLFVPSYYAMQRCLSAVQSLADIARDVFEASGLDNLGPPFVFGLWVAARLLLVHAASIGCPVDPKIEFFIEILGHIGQYWEVANNYAKILSRAVRRGRQGDMNFTAMRRSAHDLATLTSSARQSGSEPTSTQVTSLSELDNIDIFDFFNYPKLLEPRTGNGQAWQIEGVNGLTGESMRMPDPESDWLGYNSQFQ